MFGISGTELFMIAAFALLLFGPDELPKMARTVGRFIKEFKRAQANMEAMIRAEMLGEDHKKTEEVAAKAAAAVNAEYDEDDDDEEDEEE